MSDIIYHKKSQDIFYKGNVYNKREKIEGDYKKIECTREAYDSLLYYDNFTFYVVTNSDQTVQYYLGQQELAPGAGGTYNKVECSRTEYEAIVEPNPYFLYIVTNLDESIQFYLGDEELFEEDTLTTKSISINGTYNAINDNANGYTSVTVDVQPALGTLTATQNNHTYTASSDNLDGYSSVSVNVSPNLITKTITTNNVYNASDDNADGYSTVTVNVAGARLTTKTITTNGTYKAEDENFDGYNQVTINVNPSFSASPTTFTLLTNISNLKVPIPSGITSLGDNAFKGCAGLQEVIIPATLLTIGVYAFQNCTSLTKLDFSSASLTSNIGNYTFDGCTSLEEVKLDGTFSTIGQYAFNGCSSLNSLTIPSTVKTISSHTFDGCSSLTSLPTSSNFTTIGSYSFRGCGLTSLDVSSVTSLSSKDYAFADCTELRTLILPASCTALSPYLFKGCSKLENLTLPNMTSTSGTQISNYALAELNSLKWLKFQNTTPKTATSNSFGLPTTTKILVPLGSYGAYIVKQYYPDPTVNLYLCYATYTSGDSLPTASTDNYDLTWYATLADAEAQTNPITTGNGDEIYARCVAQT